MAAAQPQRAARRSILQLMKFGVMVSLLAERDSPSLSIPVFMYCLYSRKNWREGFVWQPCQRSARALDILFSLFKTAHAMSLMRGAHNGTNDRERASALATKLLESAIIDSRS